MISVPPEGPFETPLIVEELAAGRPAKSVWRNESGGLTFQFGEGAGREFLKWAPHESGVDLSAEIRRLAWVAPYAQVPRVLAQGSDEQGSWFLSAGLPGSSAVDERWQRDPLPAVRAIGAGLRALHEALPVDDCPFDWSAEARLAATREAAAAGRLDPAAWHPDTQAYAGTVPRALELLAEIPPIDRLVVCHGDSCAPNTLVGDDGACTGHVDFDILGRADRWADLAVASWSTCWNFGPGYSGPLFEAYGVEPDWKRILYYRLLWDSTGD
jgi:kanamycin kinase